MDILIRPELDKTKYHYLTAQQAGWSDLNFGARLMNQGELWSHQTGECEYAIVLLGGSCAIETSRGSWPQVGRRSDVFDGMPYSVYLPRRTDFTVRALSDKLDIAYGWAAVEGDYPPLLVTPEQVTVEIRGGENATRQINGILPPGFNCGRLVVVEVYTPSGNWSSYPPHKHDVHRVDEDGKIIEADLDEVYFYKIDRPEGYAYQRVYTSDGRIDALVMARHNDLVLVPEGYHPVVSARGYTTYYLNFLAGSAQSLANVDDPDHGWVKETFLEQDDRLPIVSMEMER